MTQAKQIFNMRNENNEARELARTRSIDIEVRGNGSTQYIFPDSSVIVFDCDNSRIFSNRIVDLVALGLAVQGHEPEIFGEA